MEREATTDREATTKNTKGTKNCNSLGNSSRGYVLASRGEFNSKEKNGEREWIKRTMSFVFFVLSVVPS